MIEYKAKREGIKVVKIAPYLTSRTCSTCGHYEPRKRVDQAEFVCKGCGEKMNADFNAALNIARSEKVVTKKEQCNAYKKLKADRLVESSKDKKESSLVVEEISTQSYGSLPRST
jgi:DNA replicative helicase MCM subunit Mcm2 (Cdc46/Mcm family)